MLKKKVLSQTQYANDTIIIRQLLYNTGNIIIESISWHEHILLNYMINKIFGYFHNNMYA